MQTWWRLAAPVRHGLICGGQELWRRRLRLIALRLCRMLRGAVLRAMASLQLWKRVVFVAAMSVAMVVAMVHFDRIMGRAGTAPPEATAYAGYKNCRASSRVVFLKTHKCASSTVQNAILRYSRKHSLDIALPVTGNYVGRYKEFHRSVLWGTPWDVANMKYDVFCLHTIWNYAEVSALMGSNAPYVTILRDPAELFISLWDYTQLSAFYNMSLEAYVMADKTGPLADRSFVANMGRDQMLFDMGLHPLDFDDSAAVKKKIKEVADTFDLVMMADRFAESMVLLKDLLCWDFADVTYLKLNAHRETTKSVLSEEATKKLKTWLKADYMLYAHFEQRFEQRMKDFGAKRMQHELGILKAANDNIRSKCVERAVSNDQLEGSYRTWGKDLVGYKVKEDKDGFCKYYGISEMAFIDELRLSQAERARAVLLSQNKKYPENFDPHKFNPTNFLDKNGKPDIEELKKIFAHNS